MTSTPLLTICIPTFNRVGYLSECLDSLAGQDLSNVEIIVRDNASADDTANALRRYQEILGLRYEIAVVNEGADRNFGKLLCMATGTYVWLLGDDDVVTPGSVAAIKECLSSQQPLLLQLGYIQGSSTLKPLHVVTAAASTAYGARSPRQEIASYIEAQPNTSLLFAFISSFVFKRSCWDVGDAAEKWYGSNYVHMYQIHTALAASHHPKISRLDAPGVIARGNIQNIITAKVGEIMWLDARTLAHISASVYADDPAIKRAFGTVFRKSYSLRTISSVLAQTGKAIDDRTASALISLGFSRFQLQLATWIGKPFLRNFALTLTGRSNP
jgi:abequosyltransferase